MLGGYEYGNPGDAIDDTLTASIKPPQGASIIVQIYIKISHTGDTS